MRKILPGLEVMAMNTRAIDITCDLGESFGIYKIGRDEEVMPYISTANVGCGFHGGDPTVMRETVRLAKQHGVAVGAHFGYYDLRGFGRRWITMDKTDLINDILYQMGALQAICDVEGIEMTHVKPHGALDDMAAQDSNIAGAIVEAVRLFNDCLPIYTVWNAETRRIAEKAGIPTVLQVYVDRGVTDDGVEIAGYHLENVGGSIDAALNRVITAVKSGKLASENGRLLDWEANSVCFHGDGADALIYAERLSSSLREAGLSIQAPYERSTT
jgi:5-oxoprolinase (ATP-hydrolysing) subunit A